MNVYIASVVGNSYIAKQIHDILIPSCIEIFIVYVGCNCFALVCSFFEKEVKDRRMLPLVL